MKTLIFILSFFTLTLAIPALAQRKYILVFPPYTNEDYNHPELFGESLDNSNHKLNTADSLSDTYFLLLRENYKLPDHHDINFACTDDGKTYRGTKKGIYMCDGSSTILISTENSNIPENNITALARDQNDHLWIGTYNSGIVIGLGKCIKPYKTKPFLTHDQDILAIYADDKGFVWVTFRNGGIECFQNGISYFYLPKEL